LIAWTTALPDPRLDGKDSTIDKAVKEEEDILDDTNEDDKKGKCRNKKKRSHLDIEKKKNINVVELDSEALNKARALVSQAKKIQQKKNAKRMKGLNKN
jgi:hypothetical protein